LAPTDKEQLSLFVNEKFDPFSSSPEADQTLKEQYRLPPSTKHIVPGQKKVRDARDQNQLNGKRQLYEKLSIDKFAGSRDYGGVLDY
jgi:hypothetical protein